MADRRLLREPSDAVLMQRTARGDRDAFAHLYRRHQATIFRFARTMTGCHAAEEDIVQEVLIELMRDASKYDAARASLTTYLFGVARPLTRRRLLRERRFVVLDSSDAPEPLAGDSDDADAQMVQRRSLETLRRAILVLPSRYREVVVLCDLEETSYADAAAAVGCPVGTIRSRLHRARRMLATALAGGAGSKTHRATPAVRERCAV